MNRSLRRFAAPLCALLLLGLAIDSAWAAPEGLGGPACDPSKQSCVQPADPAPAACGPGNSGSPCAANEPASQSNTGGTNQGAGNPINVITGNKYQREVDLPALPGVLGLEIVRHYNSSDRGLGQIGKSWRLSYETELFVVGHTVQIRQADGAELIFNRDPKRPHLCASANPAQGKILIKTTPRGDEYRWLWQDGRILAFNARGKLETIRAASGEFLNLTRGPAGELLKVTDPQGRSLVFEYAARDAAGFKGIIAIQSPVGRFSYQHQSSGAGLGNLLTASQPGGNIQSITRRYHYQDPRHPAALTGISIESKTRDGKLATQRLSSWAYDAQGRAILSVKGPLPKPNQPGLEQVRLRFNKIPAVEGETGTTELTNSLSQTTTYKHALIGNTYRLLEAKGPGCASCGETNVKYSYDKLGRLTQTTKLDQQGQPLETVHSTLDAYGRTIEVSRVRYTNGRPGKPQLQVRYEYPKTTADPTDQPSLNPILIARPSVIAGKETLTRITYNRAGQPLEVSESGYAPALDPIPNTPIAEGGLALRAAVSRGSQTAAHTKPQPTLLTRTVRYRYTQINGRSLLSEIDGPLANGPTNSPKDSDITRTEWDGRGSYPVSIIQPGNLSSRVETRDAAGRPSAVREVNGVLTQIQYAYSGQATRIERAGRVVSITYDAQMQPIRLAGNDGQTIRIAYLPGSGKLHYTLPDGQTREESYNSEMQLTAAGWLDGQGRALGQPGRLEYHPQTGQLAAVTLPSGLTTTLSYDARGQLAQWQQGKTKASQRFDPQAHLLEADISSATYRLQADNQEAGLALTLPSGAVHTERIDDFGRVVEQTSPERGVRQATYDAADRTLEVRDALRVMSAKYDAAGRILERRHQRLTEQHSRSVRYSWQGVNLIRIDDPEQLSAYRYDSQAQLIEERITLKAGVAGKAGKAQSHLTQYRYDALGRPSQTLLPEGATLSYRFDAIGRLTRVDYQPPAHAWWIKAIRWVKPGYGTQALIAHIDTDSAHGLKGFVHANGEQVSTRFDHALRLTRRLDGQSDTRLKFTEHDEIGTLTRNRQTLALGYDVWGRLAEVKQGGAIERYALDANGNRLAERGANQPATALIAKIAAADPAQPYTYRPASDQLLKSADRNYRYNAVGEPVQIETRLVQSSKRELRYGPMGELIRVSDNGKPVASYRYNQNRQRIAKTVNQQTRWFLWQGGTLAAEADSRGHIEKRYIYLGTRPVVLIQYDEKNTATVYAIHTDHLGTPLQISNANKRIVWQAEYDVFGRARVSNHSLHVGASPPLAQLGIPEAHASAARSFEFNLRFPGQYEDQETGYHYNFHRYYNPETGRYLTPDPIGLEGGTNLYGYAEGDPVGKRDPWGLKSYQFGSLDPTLTPDVGAGAWGSVTATATRKLQKAAIQAGMGVFPWPNAKAHLQHYFDGSGAAYAINFLALVQNVPSAANLFYQELNEARAYVEAVAKPGACYPLTSGAASGGYITKAENADWFFAVGGYSAWGKGRASVDSAGVYTLMYEYKFFDRYNWDSGKTVTIGGVTVTDAFMGDFHRMGLAQEFDAVGIIRKTVQWKAGGSMTIKAGW